MWLAPTEGVVVLPAPIKRMTELTYESYVLHLNYPNTFMEQNTLEFSLCEHGDLRLELYDLLGRKVETLTEHAYHTGAHRVQWNWNTHAADMYFAQMSVNGKL